MRWRYHYPQEEFPYSELDVENGRRGRTDPEYELVDTGVFDDDRYWAVEVDYAKASPTDLYIRIVAENRGPDPATLHVLPTLWFRNTWSWGLPGHEYVPTIRGKDTSLVAEHRSLGRLVLTGDGTPQPLCCDNETNAERLWGKPGRSRYPKDGINDHVVDGADTVNPAQEGTKGALHYLLTAAPGERVEIRLRLALAPAGSDDAPAPARSTPVRTGSTRRAAPRPADRQPADTTPATARRAAPDPGTADLRDEFERVMAARRTEADAYFADVVPAGTPAEEAEIVRQAAAGLMWGKQFFNFNVSRWLEGDPASEPPAAGRRHGRNSAWWHINNQDVISMPDPWEYPWYAAWDLAFHCVTIARFDPQFAKDQLLLLLREWYMHPNGQIPAYEWAFGDVNPPVHAWAALRVFELDGGTDYDFLERVMHKLLLNFTWWVNRKDLRGNNLFEGGFLGLDNVGPFDRSAALPVAGVLEQSDGTAWMAMYALNLLDMSLQLAIHDPVYQDIAVKFFEHFAYIAGAAYYHDLWHDDDSFFYDVLRLDGGETVPLKVRSVVGLLPLAATTIVSSATLRRLPELAERIHWFLTKRPEYGDVVGSKRVRDSEELRLLSMVGPDQLVRILQRMLSPEEFLSDFGLRTLSRSHAEQPFTVHLGGSDFTVGYEPGESSSGLFGGNSNWRGPIWFPVNFLLIEALRRYGSFFGDDLLVEYPVGSGEQRTLDDVADDLSSRLIGLFRDDPEGRRPVFGDQELFQRDPAWHGLLPFYEYFHGDNGTGLGASHQTGWTALVVDLILELRGPRSGRQNF
jgi:hypothetical protein